MAKKELFSVESGLSKTKAAKKLDILNCGFKILVKKGMNCELFELVANKLNISVRSIYNYFESQEELIAEIYTQLKKVNDNSKNDLDVDSLIISKICAEEIMNTIFVKLVDFSNKERQIFMFLLQYENYKSSKQNKNTSNSISRIKSMLAIENIRKVIKYGIEKGEFYLHEKDIEKTIVMCTIALDSMHKKILLQNKNSDMNIEDTVVVNNILIKGLLK